MGWRPDPEIERNRESLGVEPDVQFIAVFGPVRIRRSARSKPDAQELVLVTEFIVAGHRPGVVGQRPENPAVALWRNIVRPGADPDRYLDYGGRFACVNLSEVYVGRRCCRWTVARDAAIVLVSPATGAVVLAASFRIAQHVFGLVDDPHALMRSRVIGVKIRMPAFGEPTPSSEYLIVGRVGRHTQDGVVVFPGVDARRHVAGLRTAACWVAVSSLELEIFADRAAC